MVLAGLLGDRRIIVMWRFRQIHGLLVLRGRWTRPGRDCVLGGLRLETSASMLATRRCWPGPQGEKARLT